MKSPIGGVGASAMPNMTRTKDSSDIERRCGSAATSMQGLETTASSQSNHRSVHACIATTPTLFECVITPKPILNH